MDGVVVSFGGIVGVLGLMGGAQWFLQRRLAAVLNQTLPAAFLKHIRQEHLARGWSSQVTRLSLVAFREWLVVAYMTRWWPGVCRQPSWLAQDVWNLWKEHAGFQAWLRQQHLPLHRLREYPASDTAPTPEICRELQASWKRCAWLQRHAPYGLYPIYEGTPLLFSADGRVRSDIDIPLLAWHPPLVQEDVHPLSEASANNLFP